MSWIMAMIGGGVMGAEELRGGEVRPATLEPGAGEGPSLWTGEGVNLGGVLFPHLHFQSVYGRTTSDLGHELGAGHHDPVEDGWTVQGFEVGMSARVGEFVEAFATYHGYWENEDPNDYGDEFEEWFAKIKNLPGGIELRGGRYLNRFGFHNSQHLHAWDWLDNYLVNGRFLGDDGQYSIGGEVTWNLPTSWTSVVSVSVGEGQFEAERHGHEEPSDHEGEEDHGHDEALFAGEEAVFAHTLTTANWTNAWSLNDFHQFRGGFSGAWGDNASNRTSQVYGAHFQYEWRQNGLEEGGSYVRWRTEALVRRFRLEEGEQENENEDEHEDEPEDEHEGGGSDSTFDDWGIYSTVVLGRPVGRGVVEAGVRFDYAGGVGEAGLVERWRVGPGVTWYANTRRTLFVRGQYNHDWIDGNGNEDSVWLGFGFNWGGAEVR